MSHFTVLVIGDNVESLLAPYQENNMGDCPEEFLEFEEEVSKEDFEAMSQEEKDSTIDDYEEHEGAYGYWTNTNSKWDWFQIGGRWAGSLRLKDSVDMSKYESPNFSWGWSPEAMEKVKGQKLVDSAYVEDIDFEGIYKEQYESHLKNFQEVEKLFGGKIPKIEMTWKQAIEKTKDRDKAILEYNAQKGVMQFKELVKEEIKKENGVLSVWDSLDSYQFDTAEEFAKHYSHYIEAFAVLNEDDWYSEGEMGWFGCSSSDEESENKFKGSIYESFIKDLPAGTRITMVDCHV